MFEIVLEGVKAYGLAIIKKGERIMHHMLLEQEGALRLRSTLSDLIVMPLKQFFIRNLRELGKSFLIQNAVMVGVSTYTWSCLKGRATAVCGLVTVLEGWYVGAGAAWCFEGPKAKKELRPFIYLKMTFKKNNLNIA